MRSVYVETDTAMAEEAGAAAWSFDLDLWGRCIQGRTIDEALITCRRQLGEVTVVETVAGDEQAFERDFEPARDDELQQTLTILDRVRGRTLSLAESLPAQLLDYDDPTRVLPTWARWRTIRATLWHIADTESRYYLPQSGLLTRARARDLSTELVDSAAHVRAVISTMPRNLVRRPDNEIWTSTKLLRRLAWHEAGELAAVDELLQKWERSKVGLPAPADQPDAPDQ